MNLARLTVFEAVARTGSSTGAEPRGRIVADDLLFVRDAVRAGAGLGLLPEPRKVAAFRDLMAEVLRAGVGRS
jgi:DNA-binding transcriptional LysR family regulator